MANDFTKDELHTIEFVLNTLVIEQESQKQFDSEVEKNWLKKAIVVNKALLEKVRKM